MIVPKNVRTIIKVLRGCNNRFPFKMALTLSNRAIVKFSHPSHPPLSSFSCFFPPSLLRCSPTQKVLVTWILHTFFAFFTSSFSLKMKENCTASNVLRYIYDILISYSYKFLLIFLESMKKNNLL